MLVDTEVLRELADRHTRVLVLRVLLHTLEPEFPHRLVEADVDGRR